MDPEQDMLKTPPLAGDEWLMLNKRSRWDHQAINLKTAINSRVSGTITVFFFRPVNT
jgi:hypothetical protein